jgi:hypothetical protein
MTSCYIQTVYIYDYVYNLTPTKSHNPMGEKAGPNVELSKSNTLIVFVFQEKRYKSRNQWTEKNHDNIFKYV